MEMTGRFILWNKHTAHTEMQAQTVHHFLDIEEKKIFILSNNTFIFLWFLYVRLCF